MVSPSQRSFSGGELSPQLYGHTDQQKYATGLRTCRNMPVMRHGGVVSRPGLEFIAELSNASFKLIPFIFNQKDGETFLVVLTGDGISFIQDGGQVVEGNVLITGITNANPGVVHAPAHGYATGNEVIISSVGGMTQLNGRNFVITIAGPDFFSLREVQPAHANINTAGYGVYTAGGIVNRVYKIVNPFSSLDMSLIKYAQTGDVITLVHPLATPHELQRIAALNWQCIPISFRSSLPNPVWVSAVGGLVSTTDNYFIVTAVAANGDETELDFADTISMINVTLSAANPGILTATAIAGAVSYRFYKRFSTDGIYGFIGSSQTPVFSDYGITPDYLNSAPVVGSLYSTVSGEDPSTVGFIQQRRVFGASLNDPTTVWMSKPGSFSNFSYHIVGPVPDDDPVTFVPANERVNSIEHILELRQMLLLTSGGELAVQGNASGAITPSAVNPQAQSYFGSAGLKPITFGDVCLYQQSAGWFVRDLGYAFDVNGYRGNDLTVFSSHLFEGYTLTNWAYQQIPNSIAWACRSDGKFLGLTYVREQQILAWHRHDTSNGIVKDVACIPETPEDGVYFIVQRQINGQTRYYVERMTDFQADSDTDYKLMDSWLEYNSVTSQGLEGVVLSLLVGETTWDYDETVVLSFNTSLDPQLSVGDQVWVNSSTGVQIRLTITQVFSAAAYYSRPNRIVPADLRNILVDYTLPVQTVKNLWTLEGETVSIFADGFVVASPNNPQIETQYTVANGQITLDKPYSHIVVGIPITYDIESLDIDTAVGDSILDTKKNITRVAAYVIKTRGVWAGRRNPDLDPLNTDNDAVYGLMEKKPEVIDTYDDVWPLETRKIYINIEANWNRNGRVFIRQVDPVPMQIVELVPEGKVATNSQNLRV